jgi:hypothetical protein
MENLYTDVQRMGSRIKTFWINVCIDKRLSVGFEDVKSSIQNRKYLLDLPFQKRSDGRVARQSSAKASTAVRIRSGPLE